ncbi:MAG: phosphocholine cytidylyltransferase family protein [Acidobacteriota bacterium]
MRAVILAAGRGRRLGALTESKPKCLLRVGNTTIIEHQIENLEAAGIDDITVVVGYRAELVRTYLGARVSYIYNHKHESTDSLYSLWLAREAAYDGLVVLNSDVVFHPRILRRLLRSNYDDALAIELKSEFDPEQMKVQLEGERVVRLSKELDAGDAHGENLGILKFSREGTQRLFAQIETLVARGVVNRWCTYAISEVARYYPIYSVTTASLPWVEIDFASDLSLANEIVYPKIQYQSAWVGDLIDANKSAAQRPFLSEETLPAVVGQGIGRD